ncbi:MAG: pantoate--beta-alanine ligase [Hyphomicrobiaceae bacterium]
MAPSKSISRATNARGVPFVSTVAELRRIVGGWRQSGEQVAVIPTMGALHDGHLKLVTEARRRARRTVTSIFVNPAQFAPTEDFDKYPRTFEDDLAKLKTVDCDLVWAPHKGEMYPDGFATRIVPAGAAEGLETDFRPHFFGGVATVCCKLFTQVGADYAMFGEKDYQQLAVVKQMVRDLNLPLEIIGVPTVREADGLAMSSRNRYLSPDQRARAVAIHHVITKVAAAAAKGRGLDKAITDGEAALTAAGFRQIDYVAVRDADTLKEWVRKSGRPGRVLAAAWLGETRLIDNVAVPAVKTT